MTAVDCPDHQPVQNRDARPPWCLLCGRTADGSPPLRSADPPAPRPLPPIGTRVGWKARGIAYIGHVIGHQTEPRAVLAESLGGVAEELLPGTFHVLPAVE